MNPGIAIVGGAGMGALLMYFLDPDRGRRRRAMIQDQATKASRKIGDAADATARDVRNRSAGLLWEAKSWFTHRPVDENDQAVLNRVRSNLGMLVRHPRSIDVSVTQGRVILKGPILEDEVDQVLRAVPRIPGVQEIENHLEIHSDSSGIPGLQGLSESPPRRPRFELMQANWSPAARLMTGALGTALTVLGLRRRGVAGSGMAAVGAGFLTRGLTNRQLCRVFQGQKEGQT
ncbi:MAG TPA: BON domain-containing protein [Nitrospiraceae bacterium]|nr:BON domain-containing protein [Nitrospiraceae bacterium]